LKLHQRSDAPELMDAEVTDPETLRACLADLERINRWTFAYRITLAWLDQLVAAHPPAGPLTILDVGSGYGDMLRRVWIWARARDIEIELIGIDRNPQAVSVARAATLPEAPIRYLTADVFALEEAQRCDIVISALFAHHLNDSALVRFLRWMEARARLGWLINDLQRHPIAWHIAWSAPRLLRMNRLVRHDAPLSVARSLDERDWQRVLDEAGLAPSAATIEARFPYRYAIGRIKAVGAPCRTW